MSKEQWCYELGQIVISNMEKDITELPSDEKYEVMKRDKEDGEQYFDIKSVSTGKIFESVAASLIEEIN